ncbi:hypothetical protein M9434_003950 [Picochlorum sp. BPE23]|nr:hypothetical protein M9434_003950 [Picochlorum sp. BPE23]
MGFRFKQYKSELEIDTVMKLIDEELSEPYSIFTYRYFLSQWPFLCHLAISDTDEAFGCIIGKMDRHRNGRMRGYIGMLTVKKEYRHLGVGSTLVKECIAEMIKRGCEEIVLEAEATNMGALRLYQNLGFIRDKRLRRYYLNGNDAYRLKLLIPPSTHVDSPRVADVTNRLAGMMT